jgi:hypothetical protein
MSVEEERNGLFIQFRTAIQLNEFVDCHDIVDFLLSTITEELKNRYSKKYFEMRETAEKDKDAMHTLWLSGGKRLSVGAKANEYDLLREHQFWIDYYNYLYNEFKINSLLAK